MAKEIDKIIQSKTAPKSNNVLWDDGENLKINRNGKWESTSSNPSNITEELKDLGIEYDNVVINISSNDIDEIINNGGVIPKEHPIISALEKALKAVNISLIVINGPTRYILHCTYSAVSYNNSDLTFNYTNIANSEVDGLLKYTFIYDGTDWYIIFEEV